MNKVVYNSEYGGFCLSKQALDLLISKGVSISEIEDYKYGKVKRHDPKLVSVVEQLGDEASSDISSLKIYNLNGNQYRIMNYDGLETIEIPSDTVFTEIKPEDLYE